VWVSVLTWRTKELERKQRFWQIALVWFLPLIGAVIVHIFNKLHSREPEKRVNNGVIPQDDQGVDYTSFRNPGHD
jgi:hypothetical protein